MCREKDDTQVIHIYLVENEQKPDSRDASWGLYSQSWSKVRKPHPERIANFAEKELAELIRQYADAHLKGIYIE